MIEDKVRIDNIKEDFLKENNIELSILRLDLLHPEISGNKWFKLKYNIEEAIFDLKNRFTANDPKLRFVLNKTVKISLLRFPSSNSIL